MSWAVVDLETTIHSGNKRKANPFLLKEDGSYLNWAVMMGWATKAEPNPVGIRMTEGTQKNMTKQFIELLKGGTKLLVGVNIKFDLLYMLRDPEAYAAWQDYVVAGGNVWDCQLAEYLLQGQIKSAHMLSMDDMAVYYDLDTKVDEVKVLWEAGVPTEEIDPALLARYLLGEDLTDAGGKVVGRREGDIGNTRDIFLRQVERAKAAGQSRSILLNMGSLLASIEMERNGMFVDKGLGLELAKELADELGTARTELDAYLPKDLPFEFNWGNRYHLSPLLFGGRIKYERREYDLKNGTKTFVAPAPDGDAAYAYSQMDVIHYELVDKSTMSVGEYESRLLRMADGLSDPVPERVQYKSGKNAGEYKTKKVKADAYAKPKTRMAADYWEFPGFAVPDDDWASSTEGLYSVASEVIEELTSRPDAVPFLKTLGRVAALSKDLGTYFITGEGEDAKGMLTLVDQLGIVHHQINHTSTVTGRFSGSNPNLQNIPKGNKSKAKQMFVSRFKDGSILQSDFSALEVYVQANLTKCAALIQALLKGTDMHCLRLSNKEHMPYEEVLKLCKGYRETTADGTVVEVAAVEEWDYKRTGVKVFSFQLAYGAGAATISKATGLPIEEVEALMAAENELFPEITEHFDARGREIDKNARATSSFVMHPANPAVKVQLMLSRIQLQSGKKYSYLSSPAPAFMLKRGITSSFSPTERKNYEVQGEGAEIMKAAMWLAVREFYRHRNWNGLALLVNTVHDAQYADADPSVRDEVAQVLHSCMESATDFFCYWFKWQLSVPVPSDTVHGVNMGEEIPYKSDAFKAKAKELRTELAARYMENFIPAYATLND